MFCNNSFLKKGMKINVKKKNVLSFEAILPLVKYVWHCQQIVFLTFLAFLYKPLIKTVCQKVIYIFCGKAIVIISIQRDCLDHVFKGL